MNRLQEYTRNAVAITILCFSGVATAAVSNREVRVVYTPPYLSVDAQGVSRLEVLREISAKLGFNITGDASSEPMPSFTIQGASLDEVLRQLLRGENYAIVYSEQTSGGVKTGKGISKLMLLSSTGHSPGSTNLANQPKVSTGAENIVQRPAERSSIIGPSPTYQSLKSIPTENKRKDRLENSAKVEDALRVHALSGLGRATENYSEMLTANLYQPLRNPGEPLRNDSRKAISNTSSALSIDESLAITTRFAQQNLKALADGLTTVSDPVPKSSPARGG